MEAIGPILIVLSIPLVLRWVPPNVLDRFRIAATYANRSVWDDANALCGRHMLILGVVMVALDVVLPSSLRAAVLAPVGWIGLIGINSAIAHRQSLEA